jgi:hypothetical protein
MITRASWHTTLLRKEPLRRRGKPWIPASSVVSGKVQTYSL